MPRTPKPDDGVTLGEERERLRDHWHRGTRCACCGQNVKLYRRKLNVGMALTLLSFWRTTSRLPAGHDGWLHAEDTFKDDPSLPSTARGDFPKLRWWRLIERAEGQRPDGNPSTGYYRLTERGRLFCQRRLHVRPAVYLYLDREYPAPDGADQAPVSIVDALGTRFDYMEVTRGIADPITETRAAAGVAA